MPARQESGHAPRCADITPRLARSWLVIFPIGKASARQPDAGVALAARRNSDVRTAAAHGHTYAGHRKVKMHGWHMETQLLFLTIFRSTRCRSEKRLPQDSANLSAPDRQRSERSSVSHKRNRRGVSSTQPNLAWPSCLRE